MMKDDYLNKNFFFEEVGLFRRLEIEKFSSIFAKILIYRKIISETAKKPCKLLKLENISLKMVYATSLPYEKKISSLLRNCDKQ